MVGWSEERVGVGCTDVSGIKRMGENEGIVGAKPSSVELVICGEF